jgi:hypothetical protein
MVVQLVRTGWSVWVRSAFVLLGGVLFLVGLLGGSFEYAFGGYESVGERFVNPDGTVTYWDRGGGNGDEYYEMREEDGSRYMPPERDDAAPSSEQGPTTVWLIGSGGEGIEPVYFADTPEEGEAWVREHQGTVLFTGEPAEAAAWAQGARAEKRATFWHGDAVTATVGAAVVLIGVGPLLQGRGDQAPRAPWGILSGVLWIAAAGLLVCVPGLVLSYWGPLNPPGWNLEDLLLMAGIATVVGVLAAGGVLTYRYARHQPLQGRVARTVLTSFAVALMLVAVAATLLR